ncbi:CNNM domain-containing protein [Mycoplasma sp. 744]|uniref:CNNM domain-containing protein n=1 Tax=Mycoplasma sp. 744 TaxID=3108531 RepID=UPI002B1DA227|nr:CNNM domain-containing protein [Mycoplasma sp. 744]MEA4115586.1 CNNM domain-containing protein [Mycoplasma sp. 744]
MDLNNITTKYLEITTSNNQTLTKPFSNTFLIVTIILLIILIIASSMFSAAETAYTSLNLGKVETLISNKNNFTNKLIKKQYLAFNQVLVTILICNNIVNIASSAILSWILSITLGGTNLENYIALLSTAVMTPIIVLFGEIIPKLIAKSHPIYTSKTLCYPLLFFYYLFWPFTYPISKIGKKIYITNTEEDLKNIIDVAQNEGVLETNESIMAQNALDLDSVKVKKHFVKLKDITFVEVDNNISRVLEVFAETNYSRLPVKNKENDFIGIILLKDIFTLQKGNISKYIKTVPTLSSNISLSKALEILRSNKVQMGFVTENNSSKEIIGLITIEDILEEIVGEIYDEYDEEEWEYLEEISLELYKANSKIKIKTIEKEIEVDLDLSKDEEKLTLAKWLEKRTNKKISKSLNYSVNGINFSKAKKTSSKSDVWTIEISLGNNVDFKEETTQFLIENQIK